MKLAEDTSKKHNIPINEDLIMRDRGLSAFKAEHIKRGALGKFIAAIEDGLIAEGSILIVESMDRVSRDIPLAAQIQFIILMSSRR
ncbi:recombinase family protein [Vibrio vulnificus]|nr:recombinase family protein [Vibrio vulnificus]MCU8306066.1 recombinase family protein [Vibrio vulnificus]